MTKTPLVLLAALLCLTGCSLKDGDPEGEAAAQAITAERLEEVVTVLAGDEMKGRGPGTEEDRMARAYLAEQLQQAGYSPAFGEMSDDPRDVRPASYEP